MAKACGRRRAVLFMCTANAARSQMAEGLAKHLAAGLPLPIPAAAACSSGGPGRNGAAPRASGTAVLLDVFSAGTRPACRVHPLAVAAMAELGIDISGGRPKGADQLPVRHFDWVITVCDSARQECPVWLGPGRRLHWSIPDPAEAWGCEAKVMEAFRAARDDLAGRIREWLAGLAGE